MSSAWIKQLGFAPIFALVCFGIMVGKLAKAESVPSAPQIFSQQTFTEHDSILVVNEADEVVYSWQSEQPRIPASVMKLLTAWLAIHEWGPTHQFSTSFYWQGGDLWVKGSGDPMLVSEELDLVVKSLQPLLSDQVVNIRLDSSLFTNPSVPGRGNTDDPYNAPLSALAANFNTVSLKKIGTNLVSAEPQTPLTSTARQLAKTTQLNRKPKRINVRNSDLAQQQFGEILAQKLGVKAKVSINQVVPSHIPLLYQHANSHTVAEVLRGALEYSNNFIANQLFLMLSQAEQADFEKARVAARQKLSSRFGWLGAEVHDGAGLSRANRLTGPQIVELLQVLTPYRKLLKKYPIRLRSGTLAFAHAKSGTLSDVHSLAGYLTVGQRQYRFVFLFNRPMPYGHRDQLLQKLAAQLDQRVVSK